VSFLILLRCILETKKANRSHIETFEGILENINIKKGIKIELLDPTPKFFEEYILKGEIKDIEDKNIKNIDPIRRIILSKEFFNKILNKLGGMDLEILSNFIIKYIKIVAIFPKKLENEIYDSINSKGVPLTEADKIKNFLFKEVDIKKKDALRKIWYDLLKIFNYSSRNVSSFIGLYWTITKEDPKRSLYEKFREFIKKEGGNIISISNEILEYAYIYSQILKEDLDVNYWGGEKYGPQIIEVINNLKYLDMKTSYYLIIEVKHSFEPYFKKRGKFMKEIVNLFKNIERFSFLHINLFDNYPQQLKNLYSEKSIILKKEKIKKKEIFNDISEDLKKRIIKNLEHASFEDRILTKCRPPNLFTREEIIYLLYKLLGDLTKTDIFERNVYLIDKNSIEHIMPKSLSQFWKDKIKNYIKNWSEYTDRDTSKRIEKYHETFLNDLGNLSLLRRLTNNNLGNLSFEEKQRVLLQKENDNRLFDTVKNATDWSNLEISARRDLFITYLSQIFSPA
jgi:hypothetical protein